MKKIALFLTAVFCFGLTACSKDAEVNAFITENRAVIEDIVKKVDANPTAAGVDEAQKSLDAKKAGLKAKWDAIKNAPGFQLGADVRKKLSEDVPADMKKLTDAQMKHAVNLGSEGNAKFSRLVQDYSNIIKE
jgi:hypothetical protein